MLRWRRAVTALLLCIGIIPATLADAQERHESQGLVPFALDMATPQFALPDLQQEIHQLADYLGRTVVLNFWATWCKPCREEMPAFERLWQQTHNQGVTVIGVAVGDTAAEVRRFLAALPVSFPIVIDHGAAAAQFWPMLGLPTTFVIDPDGNIVYKALGPRAWDTDALVDKILALGHHGDAYARP